jgi:chloramphenicol 3-O-phosphotransferase
MAVDEKTMFEIFRETEWSRGFHYLFYTELGDHARDTEIAKAANAETVFSGFVADELKEDARKAIEAIVDELNEMDEDEAGMPRDAIRTRLEAFLVAGPADPTH